MPRPEPSVLSLARTLDQNFCYRLTSLGFARAGWKLEDLGRIERILEGDRLGLGWGRSRYFGCRRVSGGNGTGTGQLLRIGCHVDDSPRNQGGYANL